MSEPSIPGHRFVDRIDGGGFATVYRYVRESLGKEVAIKVLRADALAHLSSEEFRTEARIMASLSGHLNIVTIHDYGTLDDGRPYLVMDYCPPPNLKARATGERLSVRFVLEVGILIAGAVETAHRAGVLHHDIKPDNILLDGYGPKLTDFGISEMRGGTERGPAGCSPPWASLEALRGENTDVRSDVYSLAATLYTALTGRWAYEVPRAPNELPDLMIRMATGAPLPIGRGDVPTRLEQVIRRSLHPDPARRHQSALEFATDLRAAAPAGWAAPAPLIPEETARATLEMTGTRKPGVGVLPPPSPRNGPGVPPPVREQTGGSPDAVTRQRIDLPSGPDLSDLDATRLRGEPQAQQPRSRRPVLVGGAVSAVLGAIAVGVLIFVDHGTPPAKPTPEPTVAFDPAPAGAGQPGPARWSRTATSAVLSWGEPADHQPGDEYQWRRTTATGEPEGAVSTTQETTATIPGVNRATQVCAQVWVLRGGVPSSRKLFSCDPEAG